MKKTRTLLTLLALLALPLGMAAQVTLPYSTDFEGDVSEWSFPIKNLLFLLI